MRKQLTDKTVRSLAPAASRYDVWDAGFKDGSFGVRVAPSGRKTWVAMVREADGRKRRVSLGEYPDKKLGEARKLARKAAVRVSDGEPVDGSGPTFAEVAETFLDRYPRRAGLRPITAAEYRRLVNVRLLPAWGRRTAAGIRRADVNRLFDDIAYGDKPAPVLANRVVTLAGTIFNFAIDAGCWGVETNPCHRKRRARETPRDRVLSDGELAALWRALDEYPRPTADLFKLLILTGVRRSEVKDAAWPEFNFEKSVWTIPAERTKTRRVHRVPLSTGARSVLDRLRAENGADDYLFSPSEGRLVSALYGHTAKLAASLGFDFRPHDVRRSVATGMSRLGIPDATIGRVLGHLWAYRNVTTGIYIVDDRLPDKLRALEAWDAHVRRLVAAEPAAKAGAR